MLSSTVAIRCQRSLGAGFFVAEDLVLTNAHVACPPGEVIEVVTHDGGKATGEAVRRDERLDLALIRVAGARGRPILVGDAGTLRAGDRVGPGREPARPRIQLSRGRGEQSLAPGAGRVLHPARRRVNPGNSGGPLVDDGGRVVGIITLKRTDAEGIGLALPINYAYAAETAMISPPAGASSEFDGMRASAAQAETRPSPRSPPWSSGHCSWAPRTTDTDVWSDDHHPIARQPTPSQGFAFHFVNGSEKICPLTGSSPSGARSSRAS